MSTWQQWFWPVIAVGIAVLLGVAGCSGGGVVSPFGIDESTEIRIGQQAAADLEREYGVVNDPRQLPRVQRIGRAIAAQSQRPNLPWTFRILNMSDVNAISLPGGPIYVTRGLLATGLSDAELAGVIGHEVAHVNERHAVKAIQRAMTYQLLSALVLGHSSSAVQQAADIAVQLALELPNSRSDEYAADAQGIRLAYNAGYPANGLVQFLQLLQRITGTQRTPEWLQTHPLTQERITRAQQLSVQIAAQPRPVPVVLSDQDQKVLKELREQERAAVQQQLDAQATTKP